MSVSERVRLADVVAAGVVRSTFKTDARTADTYTALVLLVDVLKGNTI